MLWFFITAIITNLIVFILVRKELLKIKNEVHESKEIIKSLYEQNYKLVKENKAKHPQKISHVESKPITT